MAALLSSPEYRQLRALLIQARERADLTQADVAAKLGRPQSFVSKYESGERRLDVVHFLQICAALEIEPAEIVDKISRPRTR